MCQSTDMQIHLKEQPLRVTVSTVNTQGKSLKYFVVLGDKNIIYLGLCYKTSTCNTWPNSRTHTHTLFSYPLCWPPSVLVWQRQPVHLCAHPLSLLSSEKVCVCVCEGQWVTAVHKLISQYQHYCGGPQGCYSQAFRRTYVNFLKSLIFSLSIISSKKVFQLCQLRQTVLLMLILRIRDMKPV